MTNPKPMVLVDCLLVELLDVRDSMDSLDSVIEKDERMSLAWVDAKGKLDDLELVYHKAYDALKLARKKAWANPDIADLYARAKDRVEALISRPEGDAALAAAKKHQDDIANIVEKMVWVAYAKRQDAAAELNAQQEVCRSSGKAQCHAVFNRLHG